MGKLQDVHAEKAVLSGIYNYGLDCWIDINDIVQQSDTFTVNHNRLLYECLNYAFQHNSVKKPDIASIYSAAQGLGILELLQEKRCTDHINQVIEFGVERDNVRKYAGIIRKLHVGTTIRKCLKTVDEDISQITGDERVSEIFGKVEGPILDLTTLLNDEDSEPVPLGEKTEGYLQDKADNPLEQVGISSGFPRYDQAIGGGYRPGSVNVIGARSKGFKSGFALNSAIHMAGELDVPVLYMDTELQDFEQLPRMAASISSTDINNIETGKFDIEKVKGSMKTVHNWPLYHKNIAGKAFEEQLAIMRRWLYKVPGLNLNGKANPCVIIYDYIKLMDTVNISDSMREHQAIGFIVTSLHNFSVKYNIPIATFVQLNRDGIDKESTAAISQSDRILWYCSNFSIFKPKTTDDLAGESEKGIDGAGNFKLIPMACRHGKGLDFGDYVNFNVEGKYFQIKEKKRHFENLNPDDGQPASTTINFDDNERIAL